MNDWDIKLERYRQENKNVKFGETVFAGSSLMEMFPINKLLEEHNDDTIIYITVASADILRIICLKILMSASLTCAPQRCS